VPQRVHDQPVFARLNGHEILAAVQRDFADRGFARHALANDGKCLRGDRAIRREIVRAFDVHGINQRGIGELHDIDDTRRLGPHLRDVLLVEDDVLALFELVALDEVCVRDLLLAGRAPSLLLDACAALPMELVEADGRGRVRGWEHTDGDVDQADLEITLPSRASRHA
jgi:hypothetical protein